jgi:osmotically-inducible protein OsmY
VANHYQNGGRDVAVPDENRPSWRPQDQSASNQRNRGNEDDHDNRSWRDRNYRDDDRGSADRDPRRWEGSRGSEVGYGFHEDRAIGRSTERYGQGQSGYSAGRYGDDRAQQGGMQNRNDMWAPSPGSFEDRHYDAGTDDRFTGRGAAYGADRSDRGYDPERYGAQGGYGGGRGFESERGYDPRGYDPRGYGQGGYEPRYLQDHSDRGGNDRRMGARMDPRTDPRMGRMAGYDQHMGYQGGSTSPGSQHMGYQGGPQGPSSRNEAGWSPSQSGNEPHVHRGHGPHRGKGPQGYQRSDDRIRELVCEALADDDQIDASQIQVTVKDGEVTLSGTVDNRRVRREAEDCVSSVSGVRDVQVQLRVHDEQSQRTGQTMTGTHGVAQGSAASTSGMRDNLTGASAAGRQDKQETKVEIENSTSAQDKKHRA